MSETVPEEFRPRLCHIVRWPDFQGFGFNLHSEKGTAGQYIGKVDENSPAEAAGLKEGDRIIEVNGVNIGPENHHQVVARIKTGGDETRMLVLDSESEEWYKDKKIVVRGDSPDVKYQSANRDTQPDEPEPEPEPEPTPVPEPEPEAVVASDPEPEIITVAATPSEENEDYLHRPRYCHLRLWPHFQGYGFNLHAEKEKPGQYIGLVDDDSPASTAGLRVHDRIIEVNGVNIEKENHGEVIGRIKAVQGETRLLVVDLDSDSYYKNKGVTVSSDMPQTEHRESPVGGVSNGIKTQEDVPAPVAEPSAPKAPPAPEPAPSTNSDAPLGDLHLTAAEMKERLKAKKRKDPRLNKVSFEQKFRDFQRL